VIRRIILRPQVVDDLLDIVTYLAERSPVSADRFSSAIWETLDHLAEAPGVGSPKRYRSKRLAGIRSSPIKGFRNYLVFYRPMTEAIEVLAILHGARNVPQILGDR